MTWTCEHCGAVHDDDGAERTLGDLSIIQSSRELWCNDRSLRLTPVEEGIVFDLMSGRPVTREAIITRYARTEDTCDRVVDTHMTRLRSKLETLQTTVEIKTIWGVGWQMVAGSGERRLFGDVVFDFERRLVFRGSTFAPAYPQVFEIFDVLISGRLEPTESLMVGSAEPKWLVEKARKALRAVGSKIEIRNYPGRGYQMLA